MRRVLSSGLMAVFAGGLCSAISAQAPDAGQVLAAAREALGGDKKLSAVKTFVATGRTRQLRGNNLVPSEFEITCELPDKFVRHDEIPAQDTDPTTVGFKGDELIQAASPPAGRGGPGMEAGRGGRGGPGGRGGGPPRIVAVKQDFVRLMLGMFATSVPSYPVTFKYAAQGEAPEGKADILDVAGPDNFSARFVVQRETHLPVMLMWQTPAANPGMRGSGQPAAAPGASTTTENRIYYGDFREVDGLKLPFRIRRAVGGETIEETTFDQIRINAKIDPRKFEAPK